MANVSASDLLKRMSRGDLDFSGSDLAGQTISGLRHTGLPPASPRQLLLTGSNFRGATLLDCVISNADAQHGNFQAAIFEDCRLLGVDFRHSDFFGATFRNCRLGACYFDESFLGSSKFENCEAVLVSMTDAVLNSSSFAATDVGGINFRGSVKKTQNVQGPVLMENFHDPLAHSGLHRSRVDHTSIELAKRSLLSRRVAMFAEPSLYMADGEPFSLYRYRKSSTFSDLESFLRYAQTPEDVLQDFIRTYRTEGRVPSFFLSYSFADSDFAELMAKGLGARGCPVWYAPERMEGGKTITDQLHHGLDEADILVSIVSQNSAGSTWCAAEITRFLSRMESNPDLKLCPLLIDDTPLTQFSLLNFQTGADQTARFASYFARDFSRWREPAEFFPAFDKLCADVDAKVISHQLEDDEAAVRGHILSGEYGAGESQAPKRKSWWPFKS